MSLLICALRGGRLQALLNEGLVLAGASLALGAGDLARYQIGSDTRADTFLECLDNKEAGPLATLRDCAEAQALRAHGKGSAPLPLASAFLNKLGAAMEDALDVRGVLRLRQCTALSLVQDDRGVWQIALREGDGVTQRIKARRIVLALGGAQSLRRAEEETVGSAPLWPRFRDKLVFSSEVLTAGGLAGLRARLGSVNAPRLAIVGGSHSAVACAVELLSERSAIAIGPGHLTMLHRRPFRIHYPSAADALQDGYAQFGPDDICPRTKAVYRLAGFRLAAREFIAGQLGVGGRPPESRAVLHDLSNSDVRDTDAILERADVVVAALGYRPRTVPVFRQNGARTLLYADEPGAPALVDPQCRVLDASKRPIPGLYGIGLSTGFIPHGSMGGEPSFSGQTNGLWLWQNDIGAMILDALERQGDVAYA